MYTAVGYSGRELEHDQRSRSGYTAAAHAGDTRCVVQPDPHTCQEPRLPVHTAPTQRRQQPVRNKVLYTLRVSTVTEKDPMYRLH